MTQPQAVLAAILGAMLALMAWRRWRHDVVALAALLAAAGTGLVPADGVLAGFSHPAVASFAALLVLAAGVRNSGLLLAPMRALAPWLERTGAQVAALGGIGAAAAALLGSQGAAAAFAPVPAQALRRSGRWPSRAVAPVSLAFTLGGLVTLAGSLPNLLVSEMRREMTGEGYGLFDFAPVGGAVALAGLLLLVTAWRLLPPPPSGAAPPAARIERYTSEVHVPPGTPAVGRTLAELERRGDGAIGITAVIREGHRRLPPRPGLVVAADDVLVLVCGLDVLQRFTGRLRLQIENAGGDVAADPERVGVIEAVVSPSSRLVGRSCAEGGLAGRVSLLGIGRGEGQALMRLRRVKLQAGDVLVLQGELAAMPPVLAEFGCLLLAERRLRLGRRQQALAPGALLLAALALAATGALPLAVALLGAATLLVLLRTLSLNELYAGVDLSVVVLVAALLPLSAALRGSGLAALAAEWLAVPVQGRPAEAVALLLAAALVAAPLVNGVAAALVLAPIAVAVAARLGAGPDPFLMAVALGASCNVLSGALPLPLPAAQGWDGGAGRWRIGVPLTVLVFAVGLPMILLNWPFQPGTPP
jgi:di/tricarboxylate transporter